MAELLIDWIIQTVTVEARTPESEREMSGRSASVLSAAGAARSAAHVIGVAERELSSPFCHVTDGTCDTFTTKWGDGLIRAS